jgi:uncharacterized membrane protein YfcA
LATFTDLVNSGAVERIDGTSLILLLAISFVAGVGITAVGPGGVLVTIGLYAFSGLSPALVAGTAIITHVGTGLLGSAVYLRSGQLRDPATRTTALTLCIAALIGTPMGVVINARVSTQAFGLLLGALVVVTGLLVLRRDWRRAETKRPEIHQRLPLTLVALIGFAVAAASGLFGIGGPMLAVPLLVVVGLPMLPGLAAAQVQSIVIASVGTVGYLLQGAIAWQLALFVGLPELCGVWVGWKIAHSVPTRALRLALALCLIALGPYMAISRG